MAKIEEEIKGTLDSLIASILSDRVDGYKAIKDLPELQEAATAAKNGRINEFYFSLIYPINNLVDGLLAHELPKNDKLHFLFKHCDFIENHYRKFIEKIEGSPCCADKSRTMMRALHNFFKTGKEISFDYSQEYTYHLPKLVFTTHAEIVEFFDAIYRLYYGNSDSFIPIAQRMNEFAAKAKK